MTFSLGSTPRSLVKYNDQSISAITEVGSGAGVTDDMVLIKTLTASSSGTLDFVDGADDVVLDNTYPTYVFKFISAHPQTDGAQLSFNMSVDTGSNYNVTKTTTFFRAYNNEGDSDTLLGYVTGYDLAQSTGFQPLSGAVGNDNDQSCSGEIRLFNPSSTTFVKHWISDCNIYEASDYVERNLVAGYGNNTSAVDAVQFKFNSGNIDAGTFKMYGIKDS